MQFMIKINKIGAREKEAFKFELIWTNLLKISSPPDLILSVFSVLWLSS